MKICLSNKGFFSSIKARAASDQVPNPPMLLTVCCQKENFLILISAQMYLYMLRKEMKTEHCGGHMELLFYNRQTIGQINI